MITLFSNRNGSNQYKADPRQELYWRIYSTPGTKYFSNAYKSAIVAGYTSSVARVINNRKWLYEKHREINLLDKSETYLDKLLDTSHIVPLTGKNGQIKDLLTGELCYKVDTEILKKKVEVAMFIYQKFSRYSKE